MNTDQTEIDAGYEQQVINAYAALQRDMKNMGDETCKAVRRGRIAVAILPVVVGVLIGMFTITLYVYSVVFISVGLLITMIILFMGSDLEEETEKNRKMMDAKVEAALQSEEGMNIRQQRSAEKGIL